MPVDDLIPAALATIRQPELQTDAALDALCARIFSAQQTGDYEAFCARRGITSVPGWSHVPPMPVDGFETLTLRCFEASDIIATFRTSGTTRGVDSRGKHHFADLSVYRAASLASFGPALVPEGGRIRIVSLIPGVDEAPDSSLSQMVTWVLEAFGTRDSLVDTTGAVLASLDGPALLLGTAFGLANVLQDQPGLRLPEGVRIMETGGFKGRTRELSRRDLHGLYHRANVPSRMVVGEYGMTELSSQWYDGVAGSAGDDPEERVYTPAAWARTRIINPVTLRDVDEGETGLLIHYDPMNIGSVIAVLTSDLGTRRSGGFVYRGRATGAMVRGCSQRDE